MEDGSLDNTFGAGGLVYTAFTQTDDTELRKLYKFVKLEGKHILEVGCGDGRLTAFLAKKADKVTAIDPEENQIKTAKAAVQGVDFQIGYGEALAFPDESFDIVFFSYSLHHQDCSGLSEKSGSTHPYVLKTNSRLP